MIRGCGSRRPGSRVPSPPARPKPVDPLPVARRPRRDPSGERPRRCPPDHLPRSVPRKVDRRRAGPPRACHHHSTCHPRQVRPARAASPGHRLPRRLAPRDPILRAPSHLPSHDMSTSGYLASSARRRPANLPVPCPRAQGLVRSSLQSPAAAHEAARPTLHRLHPPPSEGRQRPGRPARSDPDLDRRPAPGIWSRYGTDGPRSTRTPCCPLRSPRNRAPVGPSLQRPRPG